jgi:hypothetical protein
VWCAAVRHWSPPPAHVGGWRPEEPTRPAAAGLAAAMEQRGQQLESCTLSYGSALRTEFLLIFLKYAKQELNSHSQYAVIRNIFCWRLNT